MHFDTLKGGKKALIFFCAIRFYPCFSAFSGGCVAMSGGGDSLGKWEVKDCKSFKARSICKRGIGSAQEEDIPKPNVTTCPVGWLPGSGMYCYKVCILYSHVYMIL